MFYDIDFFSLTIKGRGVCLEFLIRGSSNAIGDEGDEKKKKEKKRTLPVVLLFYMIPRNGKVLMSSLGINGRIRNNYVMTMR